MQRSIAIALALALAVSGCQALIGVAAKKPVAAAGRSPAPMPTAALDTRGLLTGMVKMDAHYVVAAGGGNVIAAGGGNVIAAGGGNVVAAGGGNVVAPGGGNYRVLNSGAAASASDVPVGTVLPAQGMVVVALSLTTGKPVADAVLTNEQGRYTLKLPEDLAENVYVVAAVPGQDANDPKLGDPRLSVNRVVSPKHLDDQTLDEDTAVTARYLRVSLQDQLRNMFAQLVSAADDNLIAILPEEYRGPVRSAKKAHLDTKPDYLDRSRDLASRITARLLASLDVDAVTMDGSSTLAIPTLVATFRSIREATAAKLAADPAFFTKQDYIKNQIEFGCPFVIKRPTDLSEFMVKQYLSVGSETLTAQTDPVMASIGLPSQKDTLYQAAQGVLHAMATKLRDKALNAAICQMIEDSPNQPVQRETLNCDTAAPAQ